MTLNEDTSSGESIFLWVADLPLVIEGHDLDLAEREIASGFTLSSQRL